MSRKAQMEMIGIALVIVLLIIGLGFFISRSLEPSEDVHGIYERKQLAQNTLDVLIKTRSNCRNLDMVTLLEDCGKNEAIGGTISCNGPNSCGYLRREINFILNNTLAIRKFPYVFEAYTYDELNPILLSETRDTIGGINCTLQNIDDIMVKTETPGIQPIPLYPGTLNLKLYICTGMY